MGFFARLCVLAVLFGCNGEDETASGGGTTSCAPSEYRREDGRCVMPGLPPDMPCPPGEWLREDGACIAAGVPSDACGEGFEHDGDRGCAPILPAEDCALGSMAVPGDVACRDVTTCGTAPWGDIPVDMTTEYVDLNYAGTSDGSATAPWTSVQQAVDAASDGAIVAIAPGHYQEDVLITEKAVRLWGLCPELVAIEGTNALAAIYVLEASGSELRSIAVTGQTLGVLVNGSENVLLDGLWIHDTAERGVEVATQFGPASITVVNTLIERSHNMGMFIVGAATVEDSVVRDTDPGSGFGRGINAQPDILGTPSDLVVRRSLVERNHENGIIVIGSNGTVESTVVRATAPDPVNHEGRAFSFEDRPTMGVRSIVTVTGSLVERSEGLAVSVVNSDVTLASTVVRDTIPSSDGKKGYGIGISDDPASKSPSNLTVQSALFERNHAASVIVYGSNAVVKGAVLRDTLLGPDLGIGRGISVEDDPTSGVRSTLAMQGSLIERNLEVGILIGGSDATIEATVVRDTAPHKVNSGGHGIHIQDHTESGAPASATLRACLIERSVEAGLAVVGAASVDVVTCEIRTSSAIQQLYGDGLMVWSDGALANTTVHGTRIDESERAGVSSFGGSVSLENTHFNCRAFDLLAESWDGFSAAFHDLGGVLCGCPDASSPCRSQASEIGPPPPLL